LILFGLTERPVEIRATLNVVNFMALVARSLSVTAKPTVYDPAARKDRLDPTEALWSLVEPVLVLPAPQSNT